ncbi:RNA polymerase sigma factor [Flavobacterium cerinum]|uniref:RNA polymerase sigma factor n=1 Tax=Flavobacterium cerinum TaxID=2502784 RepID=A0ABY5INI7_9FLAO|nr:sigma-70 family RNA polymerase sigma factor [Flavobacterium cerinum]UUC44189.1 RNA polymerase sigma factor [Flavobacterium cerinum]
MPVLSLIDERELLIKLGDGEETAFNTLYQQYANKIYSRLLKLTQSEQLADELLQDTFIILWNKRHTINPDLSIKSWLYKVAENEVYQLYRKIARDKKLQEHIVSTFIETYSHTEEGIFYKESQELLVKAMEQLTPQRKEAFKLCRIDGMSYQEAATKMGVSVSTVSNHLVQATCIVRNYIFQSQERMAILISILLLK